MEQLLPGTAQVTTAAGTRAWQRVPSEVSRVTYAHIFLAKPNAMAVPEFTWARKYDSTRWSEEEADTGEQPSPCCHTRSHHVPDSTKGLCLGTRGAVPFGVCAWCLKPRHRGCFLLSSKSKMEKLQS